MMTLMDEGNKARTVAATNMNETYVYVGLDLICLLIAFTFQLLTFTCCLHTTPHHQET